MQKDGLEMIKSILEDDGKVDLGDEKNICLQMFNDMIQILKYKIFIETLKKEISTFELDPKIFAEAREDFINVSNQIENLKKKRIKYGLGFHRSLENKKATQLIDEQIKFLEEVKKDKKNAFERALNPKSHLPKFLYDTLTIEREMIIEKYNKLMEICIEYMDDEENGLFCFGHGKITDEIYGDKYYLAGDYITNMLIKLIRDEETLPKAEEYSILKKMQDEHCKNIKKLEKKIETLKSVITTLKTNSILLEDFFAKFVTCQKLSEERENIYQRITELEALQELGFIPAMKYTALEDKYHKTLEQIKPLHKEIIVASHEIKLNNPDLYEAMKYLRDIILAKESLINLANFNDLDLVGNDIYCDFANQMPDIFIRSENSINRNFVNTFTKVFSEVYNTPLQDMPIVDKIDLTFKINETLSDSEESLSKEKEALKKNYEERDQCSNNLSSEVKEIVSRMPCIAGFKEKYINNSETKMPFICSLIVEAIFGTNRIATVEDLKKIGVSYTKEELEQYRNFVKTYLPIAYKIYINNPEQISYIHKKIR